MLLKNNLEKIFLYFFLALLSALLLNFSVTSDTNLIVVFMFPIFIIYYKALVEKNIFLFYISLLLFCLSSGTFYFSWMNIYSKILYPLATLVFLLFYFISFHIDYIINIKFLKNKILLPIFPFIWSILIIILDFSKIGSFLYTFTYFFPICSPYIKILGVYGITFLLLFFPQIIIMSYYSKKRKHFFIFSFLYLFFIFSSIFYSLFLSDYFLNKKINKNDKNFIKIKFALIQGNFRESWEWRKNNVYLILNTYINLTKVAYNNEPFDIAIWPEYSIPGDVINDKDLYIPISNLCKELNIQILLGCSPWVYNHKIYQNYNTAVLFSDKGEIINIYNSVNPLPFDYDVKPGNEYKIFEYKGLKFGVLMCYEEVFDKITRIFVKNFNVDFLVVLTNHALFDHLKGAFQTTLLSRIHAANYGKYIVRSTNSGYTMIISPNGKIISKLPLRERKFLIKEIYFQKK